MTSGDDTITLTVQVCVSKADLRALAEALRPEPVEIVVGALGSPEPGSEERIEARLASLKERGLGTP